MSLFIKNKLLILCIPTLLTGVGDYVLQIIISDYPGYKEIFSPNFFWMRDTGQALFIIFGITVVFIALFSVIIYIKLRRTVVE